MMFTICILIAIVIGIYLLIKEKPDYDAYQDGYSTGYLKGRLETQESLEKGIEDRDKFIYDVCAYLMEQQDGEEIIIPSKQENK